MRAWLCLFPILTPHRCPTQRGGTGPESCLWFLLHGDPAGHSAPGGGGPLLCGAESGGKEAADQCCIQKCEGCDHLGWQQLPKPQCLAARCGGKLMASLIFWAPSSEAGPLDTRLTLSVLQQPHLPQARAEGAGAFSGDPNINQMGARR